MANTYNNTYNQSCSGSVLTCVKTKENKITNFMWNIDSNYKNPVRDYF